MNSYTVLDLLGAQVIADQGIIQDMVTKMFLVNLLAIFSNFTCFLLCYTILILSCTQEYFCLVEGISLETANVTPRVSKPHDYANHMFMRL
jgi:hypothetical protein